MGVKQLAVVMNRPYNRTQEFKEELQTYLKKIGYKNTTFHKDDYAYTFEPEFPQKNGWL